MICANCEHEQSRHKGGTDGCRRCDLGCKAFELPETRGDDRGERLTEPGAEVDGESTSARLRRVSEDRDAVHEGLMAARREYSAATERAARAERERDELAARLERVSGQLTNALECFDQLQSAAGLKYQAYEAELASARTELEQLRTQSADAPATGLISCLRCFLCETCGSRYGINYTDHACGRLTPVLVSVTRINRGDQPA